MLKLTELLIYSFEGTKLRDEPATAPTHFRPILRIFLLADCEFWSKITETSLEKLLSSSVVQTNVFFRIFTLFRETDYEAVRKSVKVNRQCAQPIFESLRIFQKWAPIFCYIEFSRVIDLRDISHERKRWLDTSSCDIIHPRQFILLSHLGAGLPIPFCFVCMERFGNSTVLNGDPGNIGFALASCCTEHVRCAEGSFNCSICIAVAHCCSRGMFSKQSSETPPL